MVAQPDDEHDPFNMMYLKVDNLICENCQGSVMTRALDCLAVLDAEQLRAAYGVLILKQQIVVISGPAGSGKSEQRQPAGSHGKLQARHGLPGHRRTSQDRGGFKGGSWSRRTRALSSSASATQETCS